jgi:hypothetical protein
MRIPACRLRQLLAALAGSAALTLGLAGPAGAYLRDVQVYAPTIRSHTGNLSFTCPGDKLLMGIGADINVIAAGGLALNRLGMTANRADIHALETDPVGGVWSVSGQGFCSGYTDSPPTAATGGPYLKDPIVATGATASSSLSPKSATASCGGRRVIGGGVHVFGARPGSFPPPHLAVDRAEAAGINSFGATAHETQATSANWGLQAIAICANYTDPIPGPIYAGSALIYTSTTPASSGNKNTAIGCPQNFAVIGGGGRVLGARPGAAPPSQVVLTSSQPEAPGGGRGRLWFAAAAEEDPTTAAWRLEAQAVCATLVFPS